MEDSKLSKFKHIAIAILIIIGFCVTVDLAYIYYQANFNQYALPSFCSISDFVDCDGVAKTTESQFLGVPLAYWGLFLYSFMMMLLFADKLKNIKCLKFLEVFKNKFHYIASLGIISFIISMGLLCISLFEIHKLCIMCAVTYVTNLIIAIIAVWGIKYNFFGALKQSVLDFLDALKPVPYRIAFIIVMIFAGIFLSWSFTSGVFSPALVAKRGYAEFLKSPVNQYAIKGNLLGSDAEDAVVLHIYSDYNCPMCAVFNMMLHKLAGEYTNVRIEHHSLPLDTDCNKYMTQEFHIGSCTMARYAEAAHMQGKFWEVNSLFFEKRPFPEDKILTTLNEADFGLDMAKLKKDAYSKSVENIIMKDIDFAVGKEQIGTPTMMIGDEFILGIPKGGYLGLKKLVNKYGGKAKSIF